MICFGFCCCWSNHILAKFLASNKNNRKVWNVCNLTIQYIQYAQVVGVGRDLSPHYSTYLADYNRWSMTMVMSRIMPLMIRIMPSVTIDGTYFLRRQLLSYFQREHPGSKLGKPGRLQGINTGVKSMKIIKLIIMKFTFDHKIHPWS